MNFNIRIMILTKIQLTTAILISAYIIWEILVQIWEINKPQSGAVIRVDLIIIYPLLLLLIIISTIQQTNKKRIKDRTQ